jgi:hypothetical protein
MIDPGFREAVRSIGTFIVTVLTWRVPLTGPRSTMPRIKAYSGIKSIEIKRLPQGGIEAAPGAHTQRYEARRHSNCNTIEPCHGLVPPHLAGVRTKSLHLFKNSYADLAHSMDGISDSHSIRRPHWKNFDYTRCVGELGCAAPIRISYE